MTALLVGTVALACFILACLGVGKLFFMFDNDKRHTYGETFFVGLAIIIVCLNVAFIAIGAVLFIRAIGQVVLSMLGVQG